jgi:hypothetical protein
MQWTEFDVQVWKLQVHCRCVKFEAFLAVGMKVAFRLCAKPCCLVDAYQLFQRACYIYRQKISKKLWRTFSKLLGVKSQKIEILSCYKVCFQDTKHM